MFWKKEFRWSAALLLCHAAISAQTPAVGVQQHLERAHALLAARKPEAAIPEFKAVLAADPDNRDAVGNLGVLLYFGQDYRGAEPFLRRTVAAQPVPKLQALLGMCERRNGDLETARNDLGAALPNLDDPKLRRQVGLELVEVDTARNDLPGAATAIDMLKASLPADPEVLYAAYRVHTDLAQEAILDLSVAAPDSAQMHQAMSHELLREHDNDGAIANLRAALKADPNLPGVHFELAEALHRSSNSAQKAEAEPEYRLALKQNPRDDKALTALGDVLADKGDHPEAIAHYKQALGLQPENADAGIGLAHELVETGQIEAAVPLLQAVIKNDPSNVLAHYRLSVAYRRLHRPEDAKREVAEYEHLKAVRDKLRIVYQAMRMNTPQGTDAKE